MAEPRMSISRLREGVDDGSIDTVVVAIVDMQGRLQGKRLDARFFFERHRSSTAPKAATICSRSMSR